MRGGVQSPYKSSGAFAAVVVGEHIVAGGTLPRERAGSRASQCVVLVRVAGHQGVAALVVHLGEEVAVLLVCQGKRHAVGLGECKLFMGIQHCYR